MKKIITQAFLISAISAQAATDAKTDAQVAKIMQYINMNDVEA